MKTFNKCDCDCDEPEPEPDYPNIVRKKRKGRMSSGKTIALVTGGNKGLGFAIVRALCKDLKDNGVVYLASRDEGRGENAVQQLKGEGLNPKFIQLDVCNNDHISKVAEFMKHNHGGLDILVNNAGIGFKRSAPEPESLQALLTVETNLFAVLRLSRALIPLIRSHGRVVNIASIYGATTYTKLSQDLQKRFKKVDTEQGVIDLMNEFISSAKVGKKEENGWDTSDYGVSKLGLIALTRVQGQDIAKDPSREDILINSCCPGWVATDMTSNTGPLTIDQGAVTPAYLALLPRGTPHQGLFFTEKVVRDFW